MYVVIIVRACKCSRYCVCGNCDFSLSTATHLRLSVDNQTYTVFDSGSEYLPIYIYDVSAGSPPQLNMECALQPPEGGLMAAFFVLPEIEGLDPQTLSILDSMGVNVTIVSNLAPSMEILSFQPLFVPEFSGVYRCATMLLNVAGPVAILVTTGRYRKYSVGNLQFFFHTQRKKLLSLGLNSWFSLPGSFFFHTQRKKFPSLGSNSWFSLPGSHCLAIRLSGTRESLMVRRSSLEGETMSSIAD